MTTRSLYLLCLPAALLIIVFLLWPIFDLMKLSIIDPDTQNFTFNKYVEFFSSEYNLQVVWRTFSIGLYTIFFTLILGLPTAYFISKTHVSKQGILILFAVFPLLTSSVVRSFSWIAILGKKGMINNGLLAIGFIDTPLDLLYNDFSLVVGLTYLFLPLMILSLVGTLENIDPSLFEAAQSLGCSRFSAFIKIIMPMAVPGIIVGSVLVLTGSMTSLATPLLLGGSDTMVMSALLYQSAITDFDWHTASVISMTLIMMILSVSYCINSLACRLNKEA